MKGALQKLGRLRLMVAGIRFLGLGKHGHLCWKGLGRDAIMGCDKQVVYRSGSMKEGGTGRGALSGGSRFESAMGAKDMGLGLGLARVSKGKLSQKG